MKLSGRRALFRASNRGPVDDGQTNSVLFDLSICLAVELRPCAVCQRVSHMYGNAGDGEWCGVGVVGVGVC